MIAELSEKVSSFTSQLEIADSKFHKDAFNRVVLQSFPTTRDEYWKYTRLGKLTKQVFQQQNDPDRLNLTKHIVSHNYLVLVNGYVREDLSQYSKSDFKIEILNADRMTDHTDFNSRVPDDIFTNMNSAYFQKVVHIRVSKNTTIEDPLQIIYVNKGEEVISNNRVYIYAESSSQAELLETFVEMDANNCFTNQVTEVYVEQNASLTINKLQNEGNNNFQISTEQIHQEQDSKFSINTVTLSGSIVRNNINITVDGQNCETHMNGAAITKEKQLIDNHTFVDHKVSNCFSNENYKYVLGDQSTGVFNGKVVVRKDAQKINAYQNNGNILLSDQATGNSKPELEIYADDVKCSHGSTTGQLDENAIFYLQSRGISREKAVQILVQAFVGEVLDEIENSDFVALVNTQLQEIHDWTI